MTTCFFSGSSRKGPVESGIRSSSGLPQRKGIAERTLQVKIEILLEQQVSSAWTLILEFCPLKSRTDEYPIFILALKNNFCKTIFLQYRTVSGGHIILLTIHFGIFIWWVSETHQEGGLQ